MSSAFQLSEFFLKSLRLLCTSLVMYLKILMKSETSDNIEVIAEVEESDFSYVLKMKRAMCSVLFSPL